MLSQSPQGFLGAGLGLAVILVIRWPGTALGIFPAALATALAWSRYQWWLPPALVERISRGIAARLLIWPRAVAMIRDMPFTGMGLNNFPRIDPLYSQALSEEVHAHNLFRQTAADQGVLGLVALVALLAAALVAGWRAYRASGDANVRAMMLGCLGLARAQIAQQAFTAAEATFSGCTVRFPGSGTAYAELGSLLYFDLKAGEAARETIERGISLAAAPNANLYNLRSRMEADDQAFADAEADARWW